MHINTRPPSDSETSMIEYASSLVETNIKYSYAELSREFHITAGRARTLLRRHLPNHKKPITLNSIIEYLHDNKLDIDECSVRDYISVNNINCSTNITRYNINRILSAITGSSYIMVSRTRQKPKSKPKPRIRIKKDIPDIQYFEMSVAEISKQLGISVPDVNNSLDSAMEKMHKYFSDSGIKYRYLTVADDIDIKEIT